MSNPTKDEVQLSASGPEGTKRRSPRRKNLKGRGSARGGQESAKNQKTQKQPNIEVKVDPQEPDEFEPIRPEEEVNVIFKPNAGPQTEFLAAGEREVLYGGAAGGGKSYAMLADPLRFMGHPSFSGLLLRHTNEELRELVWKSQEMYPKI